MCPRVVCKVKCEMRFSKMFHLWADLENINIYNPFIVLKNAFMISTIEVMSSNKFNCVPFEVHGTENASGFLV